MTNKMSIAGTDSATTPAKGRGGASFRGLRPTSALQRLEEMALAYKRQQCPRVPAYAIRKPKYQDGTSNGLTQAVRDYLVMRGHHCNRVNTQGQWRKDLGRFTQSGSTRGAADLNAIVSGRSWQIEIKSGRDRVSPHQLRQKESVEAAGGVYLIARTFELFLIDYCNLTNTDKTEAFRPSAPAKTRNNDQEPALAQGAKGLGDAAPSTAGPGRPELTNNENTKPQ